MTPHPVDRPVRIDITWTELLRTPDRQLRRLLADRYRHAAQVERLIGTVLAEIENGDAPAHARRAQLNAMLDAEQARLNAVAQWRYEQMARAYTTRIRETSRAAA